MCDLKSDKNELRKLKIANLSLARKLKTEQRKRQRIVKRLQDSSKTPKRSTEKLMDSAGLTGAQKDKVRNEIIFGNVVAAQLREKKREHTKTTISGLHMLLAGRIIRKYRYHFKFITGWTNVFRLFLAAKKRKQPSIK